MAKVNGALLSLGARGQLGGAMVFSSWKGIGTARQYVKPANPQTAGQITQRNLLAAIVALWKGTITNSEWRTAWNLAASLGSTVQSGFNAFTQGSVNANLGSMNASGAEFYNAGGTLTLTVRSLIETPAVVAEIDVELWVGSTTKNLALHQTVQTVGGNPTEVLSFTQAAAGKYVQARCEGVALSGILFQDDMPSPP
jgi:hypothetical protein